MSLSPATELSVANWLAAGDAPERQVAEFGPPGFAAYVRLRFLPDPAYEGQTEVHPPPDAASETEQLRAALAILARHTATPDDCYFALWDGWGSDLRGGDGVRIVDWRTRTVRPGALVAPAFTDAVLQGPKVVVATYRYILFRGSILDFGDWGAAEMWPGEPRWSMPDPAFVWPADHTWCMANDVDPHWAGIGGAEPAIQELLAEPRLDIVRTDPTGHHIRYR